jgi:hypothetical protein
VISGLFRQIAYLTVLAKPVPIFLRETFVAQAGLLNQTIESTTGGAVRR